MGNTPTIDLHDSGAGPAKVITLLKTNRRATTLRLGHNKLGDAGCVEVMEFLCSKDGSEFIIDEMSLNTNDIGDVGLLAITQYLRSTNCLTALFLQNNLFTGDSQAIVSFTSALNASPLRKLSFASNAGLGDTFASVFFATLDARCLRELHVSAINLSPASAPSIIGYLSSPRALPLKTFKCNGNTLGSVGIRDILSALEQNNFSLWHAEFHANVSPDEDNFDENRIHLQRKLVNILGRNTLLMRSAERAAVLLLRHARIVLLPSSSSNGTGFPYLRLSPELQLYMLRFLAPELSPAQHYRVCAFASDRSTLPPIRLPFRTTFRSMSFADAKASSRERWLELVGCDRYEPHQEYHFY